MNNIINWHNFFKQAKIFQNNKPCKFAFVEEIFDRKFYEKLYNGYPSFDKTWSDGSDYTKSQLIKGWGKHRYNDIIRNEEDPNVNNEWNTFFKYIQSDEFIGNIRKFSGVPVNKVKGFRYIAYKKGGFQLCHTHNDGPSTLIVFFYFSKNWKKGDPGGTYIAVEEDESAIIFEPYNLDNTMVILHDGPNAAHGMRKITKNVERRAIQIYFEEYSEKDGWSGDKKETELIEL